MQVSEHSFARSPARFSAGRPGNLSSSTATRAASWAFIVTGKVAVAHAPPRGQGGRPSGGQPVQG